MVQLSAVSIKVSTFNKINASVNYFSYTLPNTPFYFLPIFGVDDAGLNSLDYFSTNQIYWNFGDGTSFSGPSAIHYYKYPGSYNVSVTIYDTSGNPYTVTKTVDDSPLTVNVVNALPDVVVFEDLIKPDSLGVYTLPAGRRSEPLKITRYNSWQNDPYLKQSDYSIMLYASGSKSDFMSVSSYYTNKWSHLKSYFGFIETYTSPEGVVSSRIVDSTRTSSISVYAERTDDSDTLLFYNYPKLGTVFAGTTGTSVDYNVSFVDQKPTTNDGSLIFLYANLNTDGFLELDSSFNNKDIKLPTFPYGYINYPTKTSYLKSVFNPAVSLAITSNGITVEGTQQVIGPLTGQFLHSFNIFPVKFTNVDIPFVVTFKDEAQFTTKCYPPITGFKFDGSDPTDLNTVSLGLYRVVEQDPLAQFVATSAYRINEALFTSNNKVPSYQNSGAYFAGLLNVPFATNTVTICAAALIQDKPTYNVGGAYGFAAQPGFFNIKRFTKEPIFSHCNSEDLRFSLTSEIETYNVSTSAGQIISIAPLLSFNQGSVDKVWIADADEDRIYTYNVSGDRLNYFDLSAIPTFENVLTAPVLNRYKGENNSASPSNIAIDSQGNAWVTLYDAVSTIRINTQFNYVDCVAAPNFVNKDLSNYQLYSSSKNELSGFVGENLILPSCVDTDKNDNVWVGYSHPVSSFLIKYNTSGKTISSIFLDPLHSIQEIINDKNDNLFAFAKDLTDNSIDPFLNDDKIYKWDASCNVVPGYPLQFKFIGSITIDLNQNLWVHHNFSKLSRIDPQNNVLTFNIGSSNVLSEYYQGIDGIAADYDGYIWIIHNYDGKIYFFPSTNPQPIPLSGLYYADLPGIQLSAFDGMQAFYKVFGDWTGIRWINKYAQSIQPQPRIVRGSSNLFNIIKNTPIVNKVNENFDATSNYKSYILQESLFNRRELLDNFLGQIVGNIDSSPETLGKTIYEKIANFNSNISDPEVCNLEALESLSRQFNLPYYDFTSGYPSKLKRAVDLLSVNHTKLFGSRNTYNRNFGLSAFDFSLGKNMGEQIQIGTGKFIVGQPIVAYEKFSEKYKLIFNTIIPTTNGIIPEIGKPYSLSGVNYDWGWGLVTGNKAQSGIDIEPYYMFYKYAPTVSNTMLDGVIDFENPLTTLQPTASSYQDWVKYGGVMDTILARSLYEGLGIIK